ncbi:MAG: tetratricopeptide repeat protein, partial [Synergistaceae bacterium]|nr:tetratricopeptide repeat protein [Synergistaceae bacterium]
MRKTVFILAATFVILWNAMPLKGASTSEEGEEFYALLKHAMNAENSGQYLEAKEYYERALPLCLKLFGEVHEGTAMFLNSLGNVYYNLRDYPKAKETHERTLAIRLKLFGEEHPDTAASLNNLGNVYYNLGDYPKAKEYYERLLPLCLKLLGEVHPDTVMSLNNLGEVYKILGDYPKAKENYERALAIQLKLFGEVHENTAGFLNNSGVVYEALGDYSKAKENYERALAIRLKLSGEVHPDTAGSLNSLGNVYSTLGDYPKAKETHERALAIQLKLFGEVGTAGSLNNLGEVYRILGDYPKAKENYERALAIQLKLSGEVHENTAVSLNNLGAVYFNLGDYPKAKETHERALAIQLKLFGKEHPSTAASLNNLGNVYYDLGDYPKVKENYERALAIRLKLFGEEHPDTAASLNNLGNVYCDLGDYPKAKENYERALAIFLKLFGEAHPDIAISLDNLGEIYNQMNSKDLAILYKKMAVNILQLTRSRITSLEKDLQKSFLQSKESYYHSLAELLAGQGRIAEAQQVLTMLKEEEYFDFIRRDQQNDPRSTSVSYSTRERKQVNAFQKISEDLFALAKEKERLLEKKKSMPASEWRSSKDAKRLDQVDGFLKEASRSFQAFLDRLDKELKAGSDAERGAEVARMNLDALQGLKKTLKDMGYGAALLHTVIAEERLWLILTTPDLQIARESRISREALFKKILAFREDLENQRNVLPVAKELYDILIAPVADDLEKADAKTLMLSLDGQLRYIPLAALHDGDKWLAEKYALVVYTEAAKDKLKDKRTVSEWEAAAMGVTKKHPDFNALPAVKAELGSIIRGEGRESGIPGTVLLDEDFTESAFSDALDYGTPVVHVASHFRFKPGTVKDSFLLLGDGKHLTLEDIHNGTFAFENVEQLTFSACNTAMGSGESAGREVEGLGVLAQKRGAKSVTATLWGVADHSTGIFMTRFYTLLQQEGVT